MGRHAAPPPPRRDTRVSSSIPGRGTSTATAGFLVAGGAAVLVLATVLGITLAGVAVLPRGPAQAQAAPVPAPTVPRLVLAASPARAAIVTSLGDQPARGWVAASDLSWSAGTAFDAACGRPATDAALAGTRIYVVGRHQAVVTVAAYAAGAGAVALREWTTLLGSCTGGSVYRYAATGPGVDAVIAGIGATAGRPPASALVWRRGDVVVTVTVPSSDPSGLASIAATMDAVVVSAVAGTCADVSSTFADAVRSPWIANVDFTGLTVPVPVSVSPSPVPTPAGVTPVPSGWTADPLPTVSLPARPLDPVWPSDLPTPVAQPVAPTEPSPAATATTVPSRAPDPTGPGCGWAFTGMTPPPYDEAQEAAAAQALAEQAQSQLASSQQLYGASVAAFWQQVPVYQQQAAAFVAYADAVRVVATAWDSITAQRAAYQQAVSAYDAAVQAHDQFVSAQAAAQSAYDAAVATCASQPVPPTGTPTDTPTGPPTDSSSPGDTTGPVDTTAPTGGATPTPPVGNGCPPAVPPILTQTAPTLPPVPTPPPDPRPPGVASPSPTR
jgi:hypothetical protein